MGMFDSVITEQYCPHCRQFTELEFQHKKGLNVLDRQKIGDIIDIQCEDGLWNYDKSKKSINSLGSCSTCHCMIYAFIRLEINTNKIISIEPYKYTITISPRINWEKDAEFE